MKSPAEHSTIQVELTSACVLHCSNCTRMSGTKTKESFITAEAFRAAIDSLVEYSKQPHAMVGFMGGECLLHPQFADFCKYAASKIDRDKLGLWSTFPDAPKYKAYAQLICDTFGNILLNDHSRDDILHAPVLMAAEDYYKMECPDCKGSGSDDLHDAECLACSGTGKVTDYREMMLAQEHCWIQESWSSSINVKGAFFCEVAAALSDLFDGPKGWDVEEGWWKRTPAEFLEQRKWACAKCGAALPLERVRNSQDPRDDVSASNLERLREIKSKKVARGEYALREEFKMDPELFNRTYPNQTYKDMMYRQGIAARYGILLRVNARGYWEPYMRPEGYQPPPPPQAAPQTLYQIMRSQSK